MRVHSLLVPKCRVGPSPISGSGVFAAEPIAAGELVAVWGGKVYTAEECAKLGQVYPHCRTHPISLCEGYYLGSENLFEFDDAELFNHSCEPNVGINFDVFHYYTGPSKLEDFDQLTVDRLAHVQFCDLAGVARELATDGDRILPGDGDFRFEPLLQRLREIDYRGYVSLELMNPTIWRANPRQVAEIGITALRKVLGQARNA